MTRRIGTEEPMDIGFTFTGSKPHLCLSKNYWTWCGARPTVVVELPGLPGDCCLRCLYAIGEAIMVSGDAALNRSFRAWWAEQAGGGTIEMGRAAWLTALRQANRHIERFACANV